MKAKLIRDDLEVAPSAKDREGIEVREIPRNGGIRPVRLWKIGSIIDHPDSYILVRQGIAEPADEECRDKAAVSPEQFARAKHAYERQRRGIHPNDFGRYDRGEISRVRPDGSYEPGPNAHLATDDDDEEDDDE